MTMAISDPMEVNSPQRKLCTITLLLKPSRFLSRSLLGPRALSHRARSHHASACRLDADSLLGAQDRARKLHDMQEMMRQQRGGGGGGMHGGGHDQRMGSFSR